MLLVGCSIQEELFASFEQLLALADARGSGFDRFPPPPPHLAPTHSNYRPFQINLHRATACNAFETRRRLVLENSGIAEPANIRQRFRDLEAAGNPLMARIVLDTMVTVVDSHSFIGDYSSRAPAMARPDLGEGGNLRPVVDLLVEQIE